jgi:glycosyltransferase involved in cell wall biosynthesis
MTVGETGETIYSLRNPWTLLEAASMKLADFELSQSSEDLEWLCSEGWLSRRSSMFLGNGVDVDLFSPSEPGSEERRALRAAYEIPKGSIVVGCVGRLVWEKGYREFFHAAARLKARHPSAVFLSVGPVEDCKKDAIPAEVIDRYASSGIVRFLGMQRNMNEIYSLMDVFALPSHREGFPRSAMEAASKGLPLVLSEIRGCREVVEHQSNGLLVPVRDVGALEQALEALITNEELRLRMGRASREKAMAQFDEQQVIRKTLEVYRTLAFAQSPADPSRPISTNGEGDLAPLLTVRSKLN